MSIREMTEDDLREYIASMEAAARQYRDELRRRLAKSGALPEDREAIVRIGNGAVFRRSPFHSHGYWDAFADSIDYTTEHVASLAAQHGYTVLWPTVQQNSQETNR